MVYFACTNKLNCSAERERGDGGRLQFQLPCAWWSFTKNILNSFSRIHNDPRRSKVKYHEFWQLHWQRSWAQSEGWGPCVCVAAGSWKFELVCLGLSDTDTVCSGSWEPFSNHTLGLAQRSSSDLLLCQAHVRADFTNWARSWKNETKCFRLRLYDKVKRDLRYKSDLSQKDEDLEL